MHIFVDESGSFAVPRNGSDGFCCVGALVVADAEWENLAARFVQFRATWTPEAGEIKGRTLSDVAVRHVLDLLREADAKLFVGATAGAFFTDEELNEAKDQQAYYLGANVTEKHLPGLRQQIASLQARMRGMAPQEFLQLYLLTRLIERILRVTPNHFGFFAPNELGAFHWVVDAKNEGRSALENCWTMIGGGLLQSAFLAEPSKWIPTLDTTAFDAAFLTDDQTWPDYLPARKRPNSAGEVIDLRKIITESFRFADSRVETGLQLVDVATNAFRRVVRGHLPRDLVPPIGELLLGFEGPTIELHAMREEVRPSDRFPAPLEEILMELEERSWRVGRSPWVERYFRRQMGRGSGKASAGRVGKPRISDGKKVSQQTPGERSRGQEEARGVRRLLSEGRVRNGTLREARRHAQ